MGRKAVEEVLLERQRELYTSYRESLRGLDLDGRVKKLARLRDAEGYMAEVRKLKSGNYELFEHNCPIIHIAQDYWEACGVERELFENLLGTSVGTTHRAAKGDLVCRFLIEPRGTNGAFS